MSADFTPEKEDYKILTPFKMQVLTNFPYIEADFDALTNYQLLCKVVEYLNAVIANENEVTEQVTSLYNAYVALQAYVNNYFDNLDVQEEINTKLDEMATDGSLTLLIKNYVDPIYSAYEATINLRVNSQDSRIDSQDLEISNFKNDVNDEIEVINNKVNSVAKGSPLVASSTSGMTDTTKVYVNTTDGKWYYYDGDSWEIGGTYQSTGIGHNNVSMYNLDTYINNSVDGIYRNISGATYTKDKYLNSNGVVTDIASGTYQILSAALNGGEKLKLLTSLDSASFGTDNPSCIYVIRDEDNNILTNHKETLVSGANTFEYNIEVPEDGRLIQINCKEDMPIYLVNSSTYKQAHKIGYDDLDSTLKTKFNLNYTTEKEIETLIPNAYINVHATTKWCSYSTAQGYNVKRVELTPGKYYCVKNLIGFYNNISYMIGSDNTQTMTINEVDYSVNYPGTWYRSDVSGFDTLLEDVYFQAPDYATYMYINTSGTNASTLEVLEANSITVENEITTSDILYGKKYVACGDSFTHGDFTGYSGSQSDIYDSEMQVYKTYPYWIAKRNNMTLVNEAINGSILALDKRYVDDPTGVPINTNHPFSYERYQQVPADADYITIMFGLNDMFNTYLGNINDSNKNSFYGAGNVVLEWLITNRPNAKIGIIVSNAYLSETYRTALKELAVKWGIGYIDLYNDPSISKTLSGAGMGTVAQNIRNSQYFVTAENHHPNVKAHKIMSDAIESFLRKL